MSTSEQDDASLRHRYVIVDGLLIHVVEAGSKTAPAILFLHGWPESWKAFKSVLHELSACAHVIAIDLPGIGDSITAPRSYDKRSLAEHICHLLEVLKLDDVTLVGQDIGGQIVYAALHQASPRISRAVIASVAIPGLDPWEEVLANPYIWHFAFHSVPQLPEHLVSGGIAEYFDYFYNELAADPQRIDDDLRQSFVAAYAGPKALHTGFEWYRAFTRDARDNQRLTCNAVSTPVLYLRGSEDQGQKLDCYLNGLRSGGLLEVSGKEIPESGHFIAIEQPVAFARAIHEFVNARPAYAGTTQNGWVVPQQFARQHG
jgi:pimeloyl-ACP methyl ester carboxylesterase